MRASTPALPPKEKAFYLIVADWCQGSGDTATVAVSPQTVTTLTVSAAEGFEWDHSRPHMPLSGLSSSTEEL